MKRILFQALLVSTALTTNAAQVAFASDNQPLEELVSARNPLVENRSSKQKLAITDKKIYADDNIHSASSCIAYDQKSYASVTKRILSLAGGGIRGTYEAVLICVLEELLNEGNAGAWKHIVDEFHAVGGTSTGSLLAAGLVYKPTIPGLARYKAMDILKMYVRYGYKIFDEHARLAKGGSSAKYGSDGVDNIIDIYFENDTNFEKNVTRPLYVFAHNMDTNLPVIHSTRNTPTIATSGSNYLLAKALGESTAAPIFFPGRIMKLNGRTYRVNDGGMICNQPAKIIYDQEMLYDQSLGQHFYYEIFAFGTGAINKPTEKILSQAKQLNPAELDKGISNLPEILGGVFSTQVNTAVEACSNSVLDFRSGAKFFAHLNPRVEKDYMDDTSSDYSQYMMQKAFDMLMDAANTQGSVFQFAVERLGVSMPNSLKMTEIINVITAKLYGICPDTINEIMGNHQSGLANPQKVGLEKEWILKVLSNTISPTVEPNSVDLFSSLRSEGNHAFDRLLFLNNLVELARKSDGTNLIPEGWTGTNWTVIKKLLSDYATFDQFMVGFPSTDLSKNASEIASNLVAGFSHMCQQSQQPILACDSSTPFLAAYFIKRQLCALEENLVKANIVGRREILKKMDLIARELVCAGNAHNRALADGNPEQNQGNILHSLGNLASRAYNAVTESPKTAMVALGVAVTGTVSAPAAGISYGVFSYFNASEIDKGTLAYDLLNAYKLYLESLKKRFGLDS